LKETTEDLFGDGDGESKQTTLLNHFYKDLGGVCGKFYTGASKAFAKDAEIFKPYINEIGDHKYMLMTYARNEFHNMKDYFFTITDGVRDSQRIIESTLNYFDSKSLAYMEKRIDSPQWAYQLKYSNKMTKRCKTDVSKVTKFRDDIIEGGQVISE